MNAIPVDFHFIQWVDFHHEIRPWSLQSRPAVHGASQATAVSRVAAEERFGHCGAVLCRHRQNGRRNRQEKQSI